MDNYNSLKETEVFCRRNPVEINSSFIFYMQVLDLGEVSLAGHDISIKYDALLLTGFCS